MKVGECYKKLWKVRLLRYAPIFITAASLLLTIVFESLYPTWNVPRRW